MPRLVIHPGTPQAWEIQLKPGLNFLGRGASNDFKIEDLSISGSHCQIVVDQGSALIKDMGSTNGTFVNRVKVQESRIESGQPLRLGNVDMIFYKDGPDAVNVNAVASPPPLPPQAAPPPPPKPASGLRISGLAPAASAPAAVATATDAPPPPIFDLPEGLGAFGTRYCKFHPKSPARFLCPKCNKTFCDLCVTSRNMGGKVVKTCRACGVECVTFAFQRAAAKPFSKSLASAFSYPLNGIGILIIICGAIGLGLTSVLGFASLSGFAIKSTVYGCLFLFMQNIIHTTTSDEDEPIEFPEMSNVRAAALQLVGTIVVCFILPIILIIVRASGVDLPVEAIMASVILSGIYFPMAFLAVAMKDTVAAANPLLVIPSMMKAPGKYAVTVGLLLTVFGIYQLGSIFGEHSTHNFMLSKNMSTLFMGMGIKAALGIIEVYLLTVTVRVLGLFYNSTREELGWFSHY